MRKLNNNHIVKMTKILSHGHCKSLINERHIKYHNAHQKLPFLCLDCHRPFKKAWYSFKERPRCPYKYKINNIGRHRKYTTESVPKLIWKTGKHHYKCLLKEKGMIYHNTKQKLPILHLDCHKVFWMTLDKWNRGERCPNCRYNNIRKSRRSMAKETYQRTNHQYTLITKSQPRNVYQKLTFKHLICGHYFKMSWNDFWEIKDGQCPYCSTDPHKKLGYSKINNLTNVLGGGHYKFRQDLIREPYINNQQLLPFEHLKCKHVFWARWCDFRHGSRCPFCMKSHGEDYASKMFHHYRIPITRHFKTTRFMSKESKYLNKPVHVDILSKKYGIGLEYDGIQHSLRIPYFQPTKKDFITEKKRDKATSEWCTKHGIILFRISCLSHSFRRPQRLQIKHYFHDIILPVLGYLKEDPNQRQFLIKHFNTLY